MFDSDYCLGSGMTIVSEAQIRHDSISNWSTQSSRINMFYDIFDTQELSAQQPPLSSTRRTWEATVYHPTVTVVRGDFLSAASPFVRNTKECLSNCSHRREREIGSSSFKQRRV